MRKRYEPDQFEARWRERWRDADLFRTRDEDGRPKFYALDYFPYPSGAGLSVGHCRNYIPTDVLCRMKYMQGFNVLHPMGFDAFGLPAEVEAIKKGVHPAPMIDEYADNYRRQMELIGIGFDDNAMSAELAKPFEERAFKAERVASLRDEARACYRAWHEKTGGLK